MISDVSIEDLLVDANHLFSLPDIYFQLNEMIIDSRFSLADIGKVIAKDPGLSARLLRVVNSPLYGYQAKIDTISRAITLIGIDELYNLIVATCVVDQFESIPTELVDMNAFWIRSVYCGVVAKLLAKQCMVLHSERLFLTGLLHDIGSLILYQKLPEISKKILVNINHDRRQLARCELEFLGFTHADVGRELIKSWGLPDSLYEPIGCYLHPDYASLHMLDAYLLNISTVLVDSGGLLSCTNEIPDHAFNLLRLDRSKLMSVMEQAHIEFVNVFDLIAPNKRFH